MFLPFFLAIRFTALKAFTLSFLYKNFGDYSMKSKKKHKTKAGIVHNIQIVSLTPRVTNKYSANKALINDPINPELKIIRKDFNLL